MPNFYLNKDPRLIIVRKQADEILSDSNSLQDDNELFLPIAANQSIAFEVFLKLLSPNAQDIKFDFAVPAGATGEWWAATASLSIAFTSSATYATDNGIQFWYCHGLCVNDTTPGNIQLRWAQVVAAVIDTTVFEGSKIMGFI